MWALLRAVSNDDEDISIFEHEIDENRTAVTSAADNGVKVCRAPLVSDFPPLHRHAPLCTARPWLPQRRRR